MHPGIYERLMHSDIVEGGGVSTTPCNVKMRECGFEYCGNIASYIKSVNESVNASWHLWETNAFWHCWGGGGVSTTPCNVKMRECGFAYCGNIASYIKSVNESVNASWHLWETNAFWHCWGGGGVSTTPCNVKMRECGFAYCGNIATGGSRSRDYALRFSKNLRGSLIAGQHTIPYHRPHCTLWTF